MEKKQKVKLTVAHAKCDNCGLECTLYFLPDFSYAERIVTTKNGKYCAYVNLFDENVTEELTIICETILSNKGLVISKNKLGRLVSNVYPITCDDIEGMKIENTPNWKWPNCTNGKMEEDKEYGEKLDELEIPIVSHNDWKKLTEKEQLVINELEREGNV